MKNKTKLSALLFLFLFSGICHAEMSPAQAKIYRDKFVEEVKKCVGKPYSYGSIGPNSFDCSGLVYYTAQKSTGIQLPRTASAMYRYTTLVSDSEKEPGDLVFFKTTLSASVSHVGVYIGNGQFVSALSEGPNRGVAVTSLSADYWRKRYVGAGKFIKASGKSDSAKSATKETRKAAEKTTTKETVKPAAPKNTAKETATNNNTETPLFHTSFYVPNGNFSQNLIFDASATIDWALISLNSYSFGYKGFDIQLGARYAKIPFEPELSLGVRRVSDIGVIHIPVLLSLNFNDYIKIYAGPMLTLIEEPLPSNKSSNENSFGLPGIAGITFATPTINIGSTALQVVQDISFSSYNPYDGRALPVLDSLAAGISLYTGIKVSLPLSSFQR